MEDDDYKSRCYYCDAETTGETTGEIRDPRRGIVYACEPCADDIRRGNEMTAAYHAHQCRE